ncbi:S-(hydroxymethyl)mycothiol dehydrogenase, partial [Kocuria sp. CPCC 205281]
PTRDFPMLVDQYRLGRLDLDGFVTERIGLGDVEEAFAKMKAGTVLRSVVEIAPAPDAAADVAAQSETETGVAASSGAAR